MFPTSIRKGYSFPLPIRMIDKMTFQPVYDVELSLLISKDGGKFSLCNSKVNPIPADSPFRILYTHMLEFDSSDHDCNMAYFMFKHERCQDTTIMFRLIEFDLSKPVDLSIKENLPVSLDASIKPKYNWHWILRCLRHALTRKQERS